MSVPAGELSPAALAELAASPDGVRLRAGSRLETSHGEGTGGTIVISPGDPRRRMLVELARELAPHLTEAPGVVSLSPGLSCPVGPLFDVHVSDSTLICGDQRFASSSAFATALCGGELTGSTRQAGFSQAEATAHIGWVEGPGGLVSLGAGAPGGRLSAQLLGMLSVIESPVSVTPWGSLVIHDLSEVIAEQVVRVLAPLGLVFDAASPQLHFDRPEGLGDGVGDRRMTGDGAQAVDEEDIDS